jgi:hypothetical protein
MGGQCVEAWAAGGLGSRVDGRGCLAKIGQQDPPPPPHTHTPTQRECRNAGAHNRTHARHVPTTPPAAWRSCPTSPRVCLPAVPGTLDERTDVYAFGVVLLELLTAAQVIDVRRPPGCVNIVEWLQPRLALVARMAEVLDPRMAPPPAHEVAVVAEVAGACLQHEADRRCRGQ